MPFVVGVVNVKGGAGRSATVAHLAVALARMGLVVEVWDADPLRQVSADLSPERVRAGLALTVKGAPYRMGRDRMDPSRMPRPDGGADVVLIDTSAGLDGVSTALRYPLDLALIPSQPSGLDMYGTWATLDALPAGLARVVLPFCVMDTDAADLLPQMRQALKEEHVPQLRGLVPVRDDFDTDPRPRDADHWDAVADELVHEHLTRADEFATVSLRVPAMLHRRYKLAAIRDERSVTALARAALTGHMRARADAAAVPETQARATGDSPCPAEDAKPAAATT